MKRFVSAFGGLLLVPGALMASPFTVPIPGEKWTISFDSPAIVQFQGKVGKEGFQFEGDAQKDFIVTLFVEDKKSSKSGHAACSNYYWRLAKRNPAINRSSVRVSKDERFVEVRYLVEGDSQGIHYKVPNANYYFENKGKWVDVHVSGVLVKGTGEVSFDVIDDFTKSLTY